jgi:hypothetical protein
LGFHLLICSNSRIYYESDEIRKQSSRDPREGAAMIGVIARLEKQTGKTCFATYRRQLDHDRAGIVEYDDVSDRQFMAEPGETQRYGEPRSIEYLAQEWRDREPVLRFFLDGSRRTYKVADIPIGTQVFPILAGQVGVGVCKRENRRFAPCELSRNTVMAFPDKLDADGKNPKQHRAFLADLTTKLNAAPSRITLDKLLLYPTNANENFEDKGIARIQEYMIEQEKTMVQMLVQRNLLSNRAWLIKDGSLEYNRLSDKDDAFAFSRIRNNYKRVILIRTESFA